MGFFIKKIIVTGNNKEPSVVNFDAGLNIICGPSNTGKSYILECIDYIFGSSVLPIEERTGYDCVKMIVETDKGNTVTAERKFNTNKLTVSSTDRRVDSGEYNIRTGKINANTDLWLSLIGVEDRHSIITNSLFKKNNLTWRYFLHMFLIKEERVIQRPSILLPNQRTADTGALASLLYLITGKDFADIDPREEKKIRKAKKAAVAAYIRNRLEYFSERKTELGNMELPASINLHERVESVIGEIERTEVRIIDATRRNKELLRELFTLNEQLTECNTLHNRYKSLCSQYRSDIKRLTFIVEGEYHQANYPVSAKCPFCDGDFKIKDNASYIEASHAELHKINVQMRDLEISESELVDELNEIENQIASLNIEKETVNDLLNNELKPRAESLTKLLVEFRKAIEIQDEFAFISNMETSMKGELFEVETEEDETTMEFSIKSRYDRSILDEFDKYIESILRLCKYENLGSARLGTSNFDVLVNEKDKSTFGKGYRAFLNTTLSLALTQYLTELGKYSPGLLMIDSPILSLKEAVDDEAPDSMKSALFQYMLDHQSIGQIIIIENDIPELAYDGKANIIRFTKDEAYGRYGFLNGVR